MMFGRYRLVGRLAAGGMAEVWAAELVAVGGFRKAMAEPDAARTLDVLAALSHGAHFSLGCYCEDASRCHRSILRALLAERGADLAD